MEWFRDMRALFLELSHNRSEVVGRDELVNALGLKGPELELKDPDDFSSKDKVIYYSFDQVQRQLSKAQETVLTWDQVIDYLIQLGLKSKPLSIRPPHRQIDLPCETSPRRVFTVRGERSLNSPSVVRTSVGKSFKTALLPLHETFSRKTLPVPSVYNSTDFSSSSLASFPRPTNFASLLYLCLSGNSLTHTRWEWPPHLLVLSLSHNHLTDLVVPSSLSKLQLLNISFNSIRRVPRLQTCKDLAELYAAHNDLREIKSLARVVNLAVLDLSCNSLMSLEELASLSVLQHLVVLRVKENDFTRDYQGSLQVILPRVQVVDPSDITKYSRFQAVKGLAFKEPSAEATPRGKVNLSRAALQKHLQEGRPRETRPSSAKNLVKPNRSRAGSVMSDTTVSRLLPEAKTHSTAAEAVALREESSRKQFLTDFEPLSEFVEELDRRLKTSLGKQMTFSAAALNKSVSLVTHQSITQAQRKSYGNPIAALMIKPSSQATSQKELKLRGGRLQLSMRKGRTYDSCK
jgi:hypothetical protein